MLFSGAWSVRKVGPGGVVSLARRGGILKHDMFTPHCVHTLCKVALEQFISMMFMHSFVFFVLTPETPSRGLDYAPPTKILYTCTYFKI